MVHSVRDVLLEVFPGVDQLGYQGVIETISFVIVLTLLIGAFGTAAVLLWYAL